MENSDDTLLAETGTDPTSVGAVALDSAPPRAERAPAKRRDGESERSEIVVLPMRRVPVAAKIAFALVVGCCIVILALSARALRADRASTGAAVARQPVGPSAPTPVPTPTPTQTVAPTPSPSIVLAAVPPPPTSPSRPDAPPLTDAKPSTSTIRLAKQAHALAVDGKAAKERSVEVPCGPHLVSVDKGKPRRVDAACGSIVVVDGKKAKLLPDRDGAKKSLAR